MDWRTREAIQWTSVSSAATCVLEEGELTTPSADSPSTFNPDVYFASLSTTSSLPDLLKRENELLTGELAPLLLSPCSQS